MKQLKTTRSSGVVQHTVANTDGKGANGFMLDWYRTEPRGLSAKPQRQILAEYFTSMLVLSASFKYKPAIGTENYLYWLDDAWILSLISPDQWTPRHRECFAGRCILQADMTWVIEPSPQLRDEGPLADAVGRFFDAFKESLNSDLTLEEILPFYVPRLPYWQRLHAAALSRSIRGAAILGDQQAIRARDWQRALPSAADKLLPGGGD